MSTSTQNQSSYTKLKSGAWGVRVTGEKPREGSTVTVTTKSGKTKTETIARVLWSGNGVHVCAIAGQESSGGGSRRFGARRGNSGIDRGRDAECELCGKNRYTCGHCIGW